jgi:anti-sigma-K factor RskA
MSRSVDIEELLPFYVNGTLSEEESRRVTEALDADPALRSEVEALEEIRLRWKAMDDTITSPGDAGLARLLAEIEAAEPLAARPAANTNAAPSFWRQAGGLLVAAAIGAAAMFFALPAPMTDDVAVTASGDATMASYAETMAVQFTDATTLADLQGVLRDEGLIIVDGPSSRNVFQLADIDGTPIAADVVQRLRAMTTLFAVVDDPV